MKVSLISVVVIGRNEGERLRRCLDSIDAMERGDWAVETVYVDSGSTDGSVELAEVMGARVIALTPARPTAALGRNAGWRAASGELVFFLDGDTVVVPGFLAAGLREFADETVGVVWGHRREMRPEQSVYTRVMDLDWVYAPGWTEFCGGDALFRREALERTGGFDETLIAGEEPELCRRVMGEGWRILHIDRAMTGHDLAVTKFGQYWRRATRAGHAYAEVAERFRGTPEAFWTEDVERNKRRAWALMGLCGGGFLLTALLQAWWPLTAFMLLLGALVLRTAWKARWKGAGWRTLVLYGVHSHLQQIPIYMGQREFWRNRRRGVRTGIVEYR